MSLLQERAAVLAALQNFDSRGYGTGALPLNIDARDYAISDLPRVRAAPAAEQADLSPYVQGIYDQGQLPSCVAHSTAAMQSIFENIEHGQWFELDAVECYQQNGGTGSDGVDTRQVLSWEQNTGMRAVANGRRYRIGSFAFANPQDANGQSAIKAALAASCPCVLAMLLPDDFWNGDSQGDVVTNGYHQVCLVGFDGDRVEFVNSWGTSYGNMGFGSVPWRFLERAEQQHFVYAFTAIDVIDPASKSQWSAAPPVLERRPMQRIR